MPVRKQLGPTPRCSTARDSPKASDTGRRLSVCFRTRTEDPIWSAALDPPADSRCIQIGGSARGYQRDLRDVGVPEDPWSAQHAVARPEYLCTTVLHGECSLLPLIRRGASDFCFGLVVACARPGSLR